MGGRGASSGEVSYPRLPFSTVLFGGRGASPEDKATKRDIVTRFMNEAKEGNTYREGNGVGSKGTEFTIVHYNRSPNKLGIRSGNGRTVALTRTNAAERLKNGATLVKKRKQARA